MREHDELVTYHKKTIVDLENEVKNLKIYIQKLKDDNNQRQKELEINIKLSKEENDGLNFTIDKLQKTIDQLNKTVLSYSQLAESDGESDISFSVPEHLGKICSGINNKNKYKLSFISRNNTINNTIDETFDEQIITNSEKDRSTSKEETLKTKSLNKIIDVTCNKQGNSNEAENLSDYQTVTAPETSTTNLEKEKKSRTHGEQREQQQQQRLWQQQHQHQEQQKQTVKQYQGQQSCEQSKQTQEKQQQNYEQQQCRRRQMLQEQQHQQRQRQQQQQQTWQLQNKEQFNQQQQQQAAAAAQQQQQQRQQQHQQQQQQGRQQQQHRQQPQQRNHQQTQQQKQSQQSQQQQLQQSQQQGSENPNNFRKKYYEKILVIGDSHCRNLQPILKDLIHSNCRLNVVCKPGNRIDNIVNIIDSNRLGPNDLVCVIAGTNDLFYTDWSSIEKSLMKLQKKCSKTHVLMALLPPRYDVKNINKHIIRLNTKIRHCIDRYNNFQFIDPVGFLDRYDYTKDLVHLNDMGKKTLCRKITIKIFGKLHNDLNHTQRDTFTNEPTNYNSKTHDSDYHKQKRQQQYLPQEVQQQRQWYQNHQERYNTKQQKLQQRQQDQRHEPEKQKVQLSQHLEYQQYQHPYQEWEKKQQQQQQQDHHQQQQDQHQHLHQQQQQQHLIQQQRYQQQLQQQQHQQQWQLQQHQQMNRQHLQKWRQQLLQLQEQQQLRLKLIQQQVPDTFPDNVQNNLSPEGTQMNQLSSHTNLANLYQFEKSSVQQYAQPQLLYEQHDPVANVHYHPSIHSNEIRQNFPYVKTYLL
ncbi:hypothetical protein WDU94_014042 [Cyamophila willieti]